MNNFRKPFAADRTPLGAAMVQAVVPVLIHKVSANFAIHKLKRLKVWWIGVNGAKNLPCGLCGRQI